MASSLSSSGSGGLPSSNADIVAALAPLSTSANQSLLIGALAPLSTSAGQASILAALAPAATAANQSALLAAIALLASAAGQSMTNSYLSSLVSPEDKVLVGKAFCVTTNDISSGTGGAESAQFLLSNPIGSGKRARIYLMTFSTDVSANNNIFRLYMNPTVTSNGTALTPVNLHNVTSPPASVMNFYKVPSVSANGSLFGNVIAGATTYIEMPFSPNLVIEPGQKLLVGVRPNTNGTTYSINCLYIEE